MANRTGLILASAAVGLAGALSACSNSFSDCQDNYTCGSAAGSAGAGDSGGTGGADGTDASAGAAGSGIDADAGAAGATSGRVACALDADCDDHDPCTDGDRCVDSACVLGSSPCVNPDSQSCAVICSNGGGKAVCTVIGQDADGDEHLSASCKAAPGDDCDDTQNTVYPGAKEICDGLDNDCNGKADLYDGLPIADTTKSFAALGHVATQPRIVWDAAASLYGVTWVFATGGTTTESVGFAAFDLSGKTVVAPRTLTSQDGEITDARIAVGAGVFGIIWAADYTNGTHAVGFDRVSATGVVNPTTLYPRPVGTDHAFNPRLQFSAQGNWLLAWLEYGTNLPTKATNSVLVDGSDKLTPKQALTPADDFVAFDMAWSPTGFITATQSIGGTPFGDYLSIGERSLDLGASLAYVTNLDDHLVDNPILAAGPAGTLVAWHDSNSFQGQVGILKPDSTIACGPVSVPIRPGSAIYSGAKSGFLLSEGLSLVNVSAKCEVSGPIFSAGSPNGSSDIAGSDATGFAVLVAQRFDKTVGPSTIDIRAVSPSLCK